MLSRAHVALLLIPLGSAALLVNACVGDEPNVAVGTVPDGSASPEGSTSPDGSASPDPDAGCDKTACGGACVDLSMDPAHCGACDNDCGGGACQAGVCQPVTIAANVDQPISLAVQGNAVVWLRHGAVESSPIGGSTKPKMLTGEGDTFPRSGVNNSKKLAGRLVATTAQDVFWAGETLPNSNSVRIFKCSLVGCTFGVPSVFHDPAGEQVGQLVTEGTKLLFTQRFGGVRECDATGATCASSIELSGSSGDQEYGLAADGQRIYFTMTGEGGLYACPHSGCGNSPPLLAAPAWHVASFAGTAYFSTDGRIASCAGTGCAGAPTELAVGQDPAAPVAADGVGVYWLRAGSGGDGGAPDGEVLMCKLPSCAGGPRVLAAGQALPSSLAVQDGFVYWANRGVPGTAKSGSIMRVKR